MHLAISNIAWRPEERAAAYDIMAELGVRGLEIAPGLTFGAEPDAFEPGEAAVRALRRDLERSGLELASMQSLLFGASGCALFGTADERAAIEHALGRAIRLAGRIGAPNIVFGSPANRIVPDGMDEATALAIAVQVFGRLGDLCLESGCTLALEPNPAAYGTNFMNTIGQTDAVAVAVGHPAVTVNFDLGALIMNGEIDEAERWFAQCAPRVSHVHISEPQLAPAPTAPARVAALEQAFAAAGYKGWWSVEMRQSAEDNLPIVRRSLEACLHSVSRARADA